MCGAVRNGTSRQLAISPTQPPKGVTGTDNCRIPRTNAKRVTTHLRTRKCWFNPVSRTTITAGQSLIQASHIGVEDTWNLPRRITAHREPVWREPRRETVDAGLSGQTTIHSVQGGPYACQTHRYEPSSG
jgi:hypothetical protein